MAPIQPDFDWYKSVSTEKSVPLRCPLANVHKCPRYYQSLSLLGSGGITTAIDKEKDQELLERWKRSEYWPVVDEHATSITGGVDKKTGFHNFCPEVSFDVFHLFASSLYRYSDDIDREVAHAQLANDKARHRNDWRWNWVSVDPMHYTDCPLYAMLSVHEHKDESQGVKGEIFQFKPSIYGFSIDLKALWKSVSAWCRLGR